MNLSVECIHGQGIGSRVVMDAYPAPLRGHHIKVIVFEYGSGDTGEHQRDLTGKRIRGDFNFVFQYLHIQGGLRQVQVAFRIQQVTDRLFIEPGN